jgi:hypothetical protein
VQYTGPVYRVSLQGRPAHNCIVYVTFEKNYDEGNEANPYKLENQLTPPPKPAQTQPNPKKKTLEELGCPNGLKVNGRCIYD